MQRIMFRLILTMFVVLFLCLLTQSASAQSGSGCQDLIDFGLTQSLNICNGIQSNPWGNFWTEETDGVSVNSCEDAEEWARETYVAQSSPIPLQWTSTTTTEILELLPRNEARIRFTYQATPVLTGSIRLNRPTWPDITTDQQAAVEEFLNRVRRHEEGHLNLQASAINAFHPQTEEVIKNTPAAAKKFVEGKNKHSPGWLANQDALLRNILLSIDHTYDGLTDHGESQDVLGGLNTAIDFNCSPLIFLTKRVEAVSAYVDLTCDGAHKSSRECSVGWDSALKRAACTTNGEYDYSETTEIPMSEVTGGVFEESVSVNPSVSCANGTDAGSSSASSTSRISAVDKSVVIEGVYSASCTAVDGLNDKGAGSVISIYEFLVLKDNVIFEFDIGCNVSKAYLKHIPYDVQYAFYQRNLDETSYGQCGKIIGSLPGAGKKYEVLIQLAVPINSPASEGAFRLTLSPPPMP